MTDLISGLRRNLTTPKVSCTGDSALTHAGQAHFAGAKPGHCGECRFHQKEFETSRKLVCMKAREMGLRKSVAVPVDALACKYHEPRT